MTSSTTPADVLVRRADLGDVAWQVLLRDGDIVRLREDVALPRGVPESVALRAAAAGDRRPRRVAVARAAAAWVHLGGTPPARVQVVSATHLAPTDVHLLGGVRVTSPRRTALDLLALDPPDIALPLVRRLVFAGLDVRALRRDVAAAPGRRGIRRAAGLLRDLDPLVAAATPVTSVPVAAT